MDPASEIFLRSLNRALLFVAVLAGAMTVVLSLVLSRHILGPVEALTAATRRVQRGDLSQRVSVQSKDEIGELATAFNAMAGGLQRLEELRRNMVTDVAHELRTPLSNVRGYLEAFRDGVMEPDSTNIDSVYEEAMLLNRLVDDLQELSLAEAGQLRLDRQAVSLSEVLTRSVEALQARAAARSVSLVASLPRDLPALDADPHRLAQILGNLLSNGLSHTPAGGEIRVTASASDGMISVVVSDTGQGIAGEDLPYIFERFYRVDPSRARSTGGVGLGLAIAKQLVEAHGGSISVRSEPDQGTEFTLCLPVVETGVHSPLRKRS
jgi:signal transduction histidine kinase